MFFTIPVESIIFSAEVISEFAILALVLTKKIRVLSFRVALVPGSCECFFSSLYSIISIIRNNISMPFIMLTEVYKQAGQLYLETVY